MDSSGYNDGSNGKGSSKHYAVEIGLRSSCTCWKRQARQDCVFLFKCCERMQSTNRLVLLSEASGFVDFQVELLHKQSA